MESLGNSHEWSMERASLASEQIVKGLTFLTEKKFKSIKEEVQLWSLVYYYMIDTDTEFTWHYSNLIRRKKVTPPKEIVFRDGQMQTSGYTMCANTIYSKIILGYIIIDTLPD
jgi:hypothetical protein